MAIDSRLQAALEEHHAGRLEQAKTAYEELLAERPRDADVLLPFAQLLRQMGHSASAVAVLEQLLAVSPSCAAGYYLLGQSYHARGRLAQAYGCYSEALRFAPDFTEAHFSLGTLYCDRQQWREAAQSFREVIRLQPDYAQAHCNLGTALQESSAFDEAVACFHEAIRLKHDYYDAHFNLGNAYREMRRLGLDTTQLDVRRAGSGLELGPTAPNALEGSIPHYRAALRLKPDFADAHLNLALELLLSGQFREGWEEYEWRWRSRSRRSELRHTEQPLWRGAPLEGKTILLYYEQGLGDTIQFSRFALILARLNARVLLEVEEPLYDLMRESFSDIEVVLKDQSLPPFDYQCPLLSIPRALGIELATIPADIPYLFAEPQRVAQWRKRLGVTRALRIGIAWEGSSIHRYHRDRSVPLEIFAPLVDVPGTEFFSLQKGPAAAQLQQWRSDTSIADHVDLLGSFADTAALIACLDLVITVDTAVAHVAGAMGHPVWMLTPFAPDFRWLLGRDDTPWYPNLRLFRQQRAADWRHVIERIRSELQTRAAVSERH